MPLFKDDQILIIVPGSQTTLAQLGIPESLTPAKLRMRSRMFPAEKLGEWEPFKVRQREKESGAQQNGDGADEPEYYEDLETEEGAVWPIVEGRIVDWSCFFALMSYIHNRLSPGLHTPILLVGQPAWGRKDHNRLTQFFFEKFKTPAFSIIDSAYASMWAHKDLVNACVIDVGFEKADITAITNFCINSTGRQIAMPGCGGEAMTDQLHRLLSSQRFTRDMCEQLKKNPICELLPPGTPLPGKSDESGNDLGNPASAASTGATDSGPGHRLTAGALGEAPRGPGPNTEVGEEGKDEDDNEGILDVASIVTGGKMEEFLAKKEREKLEKQAKKKGGVEAANAASKITKLPNNKREKATFTYQDHALLDALKGMNMSGQKMAEAHAKFDQGNQKPSISDRQAVEVTDANGTPTSPKQAGAPRREIEVGVERFQAASGGIIDRIADGIHRTISAVDVARRSECWDNLILVGNGSKIRGFKETLMATIQSRYIISPSSATIFTSELPSNLSTPAGTGSQTPQPQLGPLGLGQPSSNVNPLLLAATTAAHNQNLNPGNALGSNQNMHSSHGQTPTSAKWARVGEYFPEWKEHGFDEAYFLGAQVAARIIFVFDQGPSKAFMTRADYNDMGPAGISEFSV
ncbi:hypothetical protein EJ06DRAFT_513358 [Trichodelitschia bisporula]|uniref:Actin-like ATPase domain-containing protein n=1 Tax=Trichodelitschia bisporula TaxID=703511 RepID=A0A6G1HQV0_9PEZI|nr:hypothetical protein EJ06DRAFT_513358 [Trichodelitschia bisporula]